MAGEDSSISVESKVSGDDLGNKSWNDPHYFFCLPSILKEDEEDLDVGVRDKQNRNNLL